MSYFSFCHGCQIRITELQLGFINLYTNVISVTFFSIILIFYSYLIYIFVSDFGYIILRRFYGKNQVVNKPIKILEYIYILTTVM